MRNLLEQLHKDEPDPMDAARDAMRAPLPKRFYKQVAVAALEDGRHGIELDGRPVRTPAGNLLALPTEPAAQLVAAEFDAQESQIDPADMPVTRLVNTAIDGVSAELQAVHEDVLRFAASDLLCYRAGSPAALAERQTALWDPYLDWLRADLGANLVLAEGVMHVEQPREAIAAISAGLRAFDEPLRLACIHVFTTLTGSAVLALAVAKGQGDAEAAWAAAHVDEAWNEQQWGEDAEAAARRAARKREMLAAEALFRAL